MPEKPPMKRFRITRTTVEVAEIAAYYQETAEALVNANAVGMWQTRPPETKIEFIGELKTK